MLKGRFALGMETALDQAGSVARLLQRRVVNEGKSDGTTLPNDDEVLRRKRGAKTLADEVVQEILLVAASSLFDPNQVALDAEEETPSTKRFAALSSDAETSLIVDPIDGTLEYIEGYDIYSICVGLVRNGMMETAFVYFPARDICYALDETRRSFVVRDFSIVGWSKAEELFTLKHHGRRIYVNGRVEKDVLTRLRTRDYEVIQDTELPGGPPDCILTCFTGESLGYIAHTRQVRDVLMGAIVGGARGGKALTWTGEALMWPAGGRVRRALFTTDEMPDDLISCLSGRSS